MISIVDHLDGERLLVGTWCQLPSPDVVELAAHSGFDFVVVDLEHGRFGGIDLADVLRAADAGGIPAIVRLDGPATVGSALDAGASGVVVPHVDEPAAAERAVRASRYAPDGERGASPGVRSSWTAGDGWASYARSANLETVVGVMLEGRGAVECADDIMSVAGLRIAFVGPMDLSSSLGVPGELHHEKVTSAVERIADAAASRGVRLGAWAPDAETAAPWVERGLGMVALSSDALQIGSAFRRLRESADALRAVPVVRRHA